MIEMERFFSKLVSKKFWILLSTGRPWNAFPVAVIGFSAAILTNSNIAVTTSLLISFSLACVYIAGAILNDVFGQNHDKINAPYLPIIRGAVEPTEALRFAILTYILGVLLAFLVNFTFFIIFLLFIAFSLFYSIPPIRAERRGFFAQGYLAFTTGFMPAIAGAAAAGSFNIHVLTAFALFSLFFAFALIIKDFKDILGDAAVGKRTFVIRVGRRFALNVAQIGTIVFLPSALYAFYLLRPSPFLLISGLTVLLLIIHFQRFVNIDAEDAFAKMRISISLLLIVLLLWSVGI